MFWMHERTGGNIPKGYSRRNTVCASGEFSKKRFNSCDVAKTFRTIDSREVWHSKGRDGLARRSEREGTRVEDRHRSVRSATERWHERFVQMESS